jgi:hypothetical protein
MIHSAMPTATTRGSSLPWLRTSRLCALIAAAMGSVSQSSIAQASPPVQAPQVQPAQPQHPQGVHKAPSPYKTFRSAHPPVTAPAPAPAPDPAPALVVPEPPKWPLNDPPAPASIRWDSLGLHVAATNSSLRQILDDVSTATGAKVEGLQGDERVFGEYGPGPARDVLSQILHGSSYNVLMLGDEGQGTPRQIILSERTRAGGAPGQAGQAFNRQNSQDDDVEQPVEAEEPNQQMPIRPPIVQPINQPPPGVPMTPQQRMLELQRQQMQMQQQQQQNQPVPQPEPPPQ